MGWQRTKGVLPMVYLPFTSRYGVTRGEIEEFVGDEVVRVLVE